MEFHKSCNLTVAAVATGFMDDNSAVLLLVAVVSIPLAFLFLQHFLDYRWMEKEVRLRGFRRMSIRLAKDTIPGDPGHSILPPKRYPLYYRIVVMDSKNETRVYYYRSTFPMPGVFFEDPASVQRRRVKHSRE